MVDGSRAPSPYIAATPLPPYARPDLAFQVTIPFTAVAGTPDFQYVVPGKYWLLVASVYALVTTDGNAGNRTVFCSAVDGLGNGLSNISATAAQPASMAFAYTWGASVSVA